MKHRDRVCTALAHERPDRCPMQISFTPEFASRLEEHFGLGEGEQHNPHGGGNTYVVERMLDEDILLTSVGWANSYYAGEEYVDEWGVGWKSCSYETPFGKGTYTEIATHPLADEAAISSYRAPSPHRDELYADAGRLIREYGDEYWITGVTVTTIFETAWALRGMENLMMDFISEPERADAVLDIPFRYHFEAAKRLVTMGADMIWTGDYVGGQASMIISPELWRRFFKPRMAEFFAGLKAINPDVKIAYHSDGNILPIISDLIEIGLDVLNPIQPASMDPAFLKREYGKQLSFWGTIDEQHTLPFGTPNDVRKEVEERLATVGVDGGFIIGPTHHVQLDTPMENFFAMVDTVRDSVRS